MRKVFCLFLLFVLGGLFNSSADEVWKAGIAVCDITPPTGLWLAGYAMRDHPAEGAIHPLWVKALALQDAPGKTAVIVSSDILGFTAEMSQRIKQQVKEKTGLDTGDILLNSSHTHSGPIVGDSLIAMYIISEDTEHLDKIQRYTEELERKVVDTIVNAMEHLEPAKLFMGRGVVRFAVNRRNNKEAEIETTYDYKGPVDHSVPILVVKNVIDDTIRSMVFGYACHSTVLSGYQWCGDYPGFAQIDLEQTYPTAKALFVAGCGADINPLPRRTIALAQQYGKELAAAVTRAIEDNLQELPPSLKTSYETVTLPLETPLTKEELQQISDDTKKAEYIRRSARYLLKKLERGIPLRTSYPYPIQVWNMGGFPVIALGGEVVVDYAIAVKQRIEPNAMVLGYSNDLMSYIPSVRVIREGGYEGDTSQLEYEMPAKWKEEIEELILNAIAQMWAKIK
ncbi:MAG TPA: neutral/alkaline non-lysosomal ceramidase N-terminal domain-containing protein [Candidatus Hydrogenedens sp.]|nr:neutral/alkaline non-lysosomal ceramidase N-terminal domain-containing protein [Candidatus Hydrogenedens sp.]